MRDSDGIGVLPFRKFAKEKRVNQRRFLVVKNREKLFEQQLIRDKLGGVRRIGDIEAVCAELLQR
jgi:hypothetical protein